MPRSHSRQHQRTYTTRTSRLWSMFAATTPDVQNTSTHQVKLAAHMWRETQTSPLVIKFLEQNTELVDMCADVRRLPILEELYIKEINPMLNVQANDLQALPSMKRTKAKNSLLTEKPSEDQTTNQRLPLKKTRSKSYLPITGANRLRGRQTSAINSTSPRI
ncbi:hypothetical protein GWK47_000698 [Chionoecetes opilio]|uniref:Uncharacterized protein n=1 Tax=Chionoecetes opilio TaxID=41210 RepID=A0A8J4Y572_CHIOP|nr:hypothetical protein GWK47_000698 [Chionoecetes opilio]